jgi:hypothetical protein
MNAQWKISWQSAAVVGVAILLWSSAMLLFVHLDGLTPPAMVRLALIVALPVGVHVAIVAVAFRGGLYLAAINRPGRFTVAAISATYMLLFCFSSLLPLQRTVALQVQLPSEASGQGILMMTASPALRHMLIPIVMGLAVSFCVARVMKARSGVG